MMKKIFFMALALLAAGSVSAQYYTPRSSGYSYNSGSNNSFYQPRVGLDVGVNFANTIGAYNSNYSTGTVAGLNVGLTFDLPILYPLSFAPEAIFSQKGYTAVTPSGNFTQRTNWIDVPLLAKFKIGPIFNLYVGPQYSFKLSTTNTYNNGFVVTSQQYYNNYGTTGQLNGVAGVSFDLSHWVDLHARYTIDWKATTSPNPAYQPDYRNQVFQIGFGFKF